MIPQRSRASTTASASDTQASASGRGRSPNNGSRAEPATRFSTSVSGWDAAPPASEEDTTLTLRAGIDPGDPLTQKGRIKKRFRDRDFMDPDDPDRYRYKAYHIRRAFDLFGHIPTIINDGIKRRARELAGDADACSVQSNREYETFNLILNHLEGLNDDINRLKRRPKEFRTLVRKIRDAADQARNNDTANLKKDIPYMLTADGSSVLTFVVKGKKPSSKHDRGFDNEVMGKHLCPISLDWEDPLVQNDIREGKLRIQAQDWPRLLYADCECDLDDLESGLGRNMALVRVVKHLFTGRSAAFSESAGGKTTRSGNAALAGMKEITPRVVAYAACMLRYAISNEESWSIVDKEFNMQEFYWHVVDIFEDSGDFGNELLAWWNMKVFGTGMDTSLKPKTQEAPASLTMLRKQRQVKHTSQLVLRNTTNTSRTTRDIGDSPESEPEDAGLAESIAHRTPYTSRSSDQNDISGYCHQATSVHRLSAAYHSPSPQYVRGTDLRPTTAPSSQGHGLRTQSQSPVSSTDCYPGDIGRTQPGAANLAIRHSHHIEPQRSLVESQTTAESLVSHVQKYGLPPIQVHNQRVLPPPPWYHSPRNATSS